MVVVDRSIILDNFRIAKEYLEARGVKASVMQKNFYSPLRIDEILEGDYHQLWGSHVGSLNYVLGESLYLDPDYSGGIITTLEEALAVQYKYTSLRKKFKGYIPLNWGDDREGLDLESTLELLRQCTDLSNEYFDCSNIMLTSGCLHDEVPSYLDFEELCIVLGQNGCQNLSLGGSYWLQFDSFPEIVEECRLGEFIIFGTIPFCGVDQPITGRPAVTVELKIAQVYKDRRQVLASGGSVYFDACYSKLLTPQLTFAQQSTEYTILSYIQDLSIKKGDTVRFLPNYHSLIKLLR